MKLASFALIVGVSGVIAITGAPEARADEPAAPPPKIEEAIQRAASEGVPLLVEFYTTWCGPCHEFADTALVDPEVQAALASVVWVRYDAEAEPGIAAAMRYNVSAYPTFLAVDGHGVERHRTAGYQPQTGIADFLAFISDAKDAALDERAVRALLKDKTNDPSGQLRAARWFAARDMSADAVAAYQTLAANPVASPEQRAEAATIAARMRRLAQWKQQLIAEKVALIHAHPERASESDLLLAALGSPAAHELAGMVLRAQRPEQLNELLYTAIAIGAVDEAIEAGNRMVGDRKDADHLDTLAECYYARGDRADALRIEDEALAIARTSIPELKANRARFESGSDESPYVRQARNRAAAIWAALDKVEDAIAPPPPNAGFAEARAFASALHKLGEQAAAACHGAAGKSTFAYAKLTVGTDHHVQSSQLFLDAGAPAALRACLTRTLAGAALPAVEYHGQTDVQISFARATH